jgi:predicted ATP-dependent serine protease
MSDERSSLLHCKGEFFNLKSLAEGRKEIRMLDQSTGTEIKGHQLEKLDANKQEINELDNNAELEAVVGGGFIQKHPLLTVGGALGIGGVVGFGGGLGTDTRPIVG